MALAYDQINRIIDNRGQVDVIFLDLSKAFDSVSHPHLISKMESFGFTGPLLQWFKDYLNNRTQSTVINNHKSESANVLSGVPQGSILGPLLFLMFVNDLPSVIQGNCYTALYADDSKVYKEINSLEDNLQLQEQLDNLVRWSEDWQLKFNSTKCTYMSITRRISPFHFIYNINGTPLIKVQQMKDLGLVIQDNLMWNEHISNIIKKANTNLYFIKRTLGPLAPEKAKLILYKALVRSQIEYGSNIWSTISKNNLEILESVQRRATKFICRYEDINYKDRLIRCNLVPLSFRREMLDIFFIHKARSGSLGHVIQAMCISAPPARNLRWNSDLTSIRAGFTHTETFAHFFSNRIAPIWNYLPQQIRGLPYLEKSIRFKNAVKRVYHLRVNTYFEWENTCTWVTRCRCHLCRPA